MKVNFFLVLILGAVLSFSSCKKGDMGPQGEQGQKGDQGLQGIKGSDGATILSGTVAPIASLGKIGDFYLRTSNSVLYGPKTAEGWGTGVSLKGATGAAGSKILSGTAIPAANVGVVGDYYFQTNTSILYGPKDASGWGVGTNLRGTANVMYSGWKTAVRVKDSLLDGTSVRIAHIYAPQITSSVITSGVVLVYLDYGGGTFPLPFTSRASGRMSTISFKLKTNEVVIYRMVYDGGALLNLGSNIQYRYVIIPGGVFVAKGLKDVDLSDIETVERVLGQ